MLSDSEPPAQVKLAKLTNQARRPAPSVPNRGFHIRRGNFCLSHMDCSCRRPFDQGHPLSDPGILTYRVDLRTLSFQRHLCFSALGSNRAWFQFCRCTRFLREPLQSNFIEITKGHISGIQDPGMGSRYTSFFQNLNRKCTV